MKTSTGCQERGSARHASAIFGHQVTGDSLTDYISGTQGTGVRQSDFMVESTTDSVILEPALTAVIGVAATSTTIQPLTTSAM